LIGVALHAAKAVRTLYGGIVAQFGQASAAVAAQFYDEQRTAAAVPGQFTAALADPLPERMLDKVVTSAFLGGEPADHAHADEPAQTTGDLPVEQRVPARLDDGLQRLVLQPGRETIARTRRKTQPGRGMCGFRRGRRRARFVCFSPRGRSTASSAATSRWRARAGLTRRSTTSIAIARRCRSSRANPPGTCRRISVTIRTCITRLPRMRARTATPQNPGVHAYIARPEIGSTATVFGRSKLGGFFDAQEAPSNDRTNPETMPGAAAAPSVAPAAAPQSAPAEQGEQASQQPTAPTVAPTVAPDNRPPWEKAGVPFDPERAWNLTQNLRSELAEYKAKTDPIVAEREQLRRASQSELDRANEDLTKAHTTAETWRTQAIRAKAEALAAGRFVDTETALALIGDVSTFATDDGIDTARLTARLDQLAADKPFLVAAPPQPPGFTPNRAQGQSGTGGAMPLDAQIRAAEKSGDIATSIALKQQRYHQQIQNRS
jgi:predicted transcriptional regulator